MGGDGRTGMDASTANLRGQDFGLVGRLRNQPVSLDQPVHRACCAARYSRAAPMARVTVRCVALPCEVDFGWVCRPEGGRAFDRTA
jgi:hypothetical protein